ncbi:MAG: PQQ-binding-like beta-propeller repeat protein [Planctomycetes bacterium]|nr:PQQ-binding-like beta-propeller repeat protein [Planctomycetota bacterium]
MFNTRRFRLAMGIAGFVAVMFMTQQTVQGQKAAPGPGVDKKDTEPRTSAFDLPLDDKKAPKIILAVLKHLKPELPPEEWKDIIYNLQTLLDESIEKDRLVEWVDPLSKDKKPKPESIRIVANKLIGRFSKQGLDSYQHEVGAKADERLKEAIANSDKSILAEVSQRYFHTKAGAEATMLLGRNHLDRGRYDSAAVTFRRLMERNQADSMPVHVNFMAALAWKRLAITASSREEKDLYTKFADEFWEKVKKEVSNKEVAFGPKKFKIDQLRAEYLRGIDIGPKDIGKVWPYAKGNAANNAQGDGSRPFLDPIWQFSLMPILHKEDQEKKGAAMAWIDQNLKQFMTMIDQRPNHPPIPGFFPIASPGKIMFRTYDGIYCLATRDDASQTPPVKAGELLWVRECKHSLYSMVREGHARNQIDTQWKNFYVQQGPLGIFFENGLIGSLSHDGTLVYFVDDIAMPPHPQHQMQFGFNGQQMMFGQTFQDMVHHNVLQAVNLETGKLVWMAGGRDKEKKAPLPPGEVEKETAQTVLSDAFFLGAPLALGGKLYVVIEKDKELRLICLDPSRSDPVTKQPELVWSQPLGSPNTAMPFDTLRRIQGISLAYSDNTLVVPTNAGAVLCIYLLSHSIIWARPYRLTQNAAPNDPNQPQIGRRPFNQPINANQFLNADRWRSSTPIIISGKVVFTAYDANSVMCLNLRDGEILWEVTRGSDDLYIGGVHDNKVIVVGKNSVKFLDLNKGTALGMVNTGIPSGVGTASNDVYFLPIKPSRDNPEPEILSIDVKEMKVIAHTRSRKKVPTGNLVFFDGAVFSQTAFNITSFPQLNLKIEEAKKRLAANQNDPIGLADMGDLWLDDGKLTEAIDAYNKCLANNPNADTKSKAREKLYDSITELLQQNFNSGEKMLDQYKELCNVEIGADLDPLKKQQLADEELRRKSNYFCLIAKGKESQGKLVEAFENYMSFGTLTGNKELVSVIDQPNTFARPDVWARGRINHMLDKATPEQRKPLEARAATEWEAVKKSSDLEKLRGFVRIFGTRFASGNEARLMLAEKLIATNNEEDFRDAENILLSLKGLEEPLYAAQATEVLARLYIRKGLLDDAMGLYSDLHRNFAKITIRDNKTGDDYFNDLITDKRFLPYIEPLRQSWMNTKFKASEVNQFQGNQQPQSFTITPEGESIPFFNRHKIVMDMMFQGSAMWVLKVVDRITGEERFRSQPMTAPQYIWNYPQTNNHRFAQIRGHLLILNLNHMVYAFDLADRKKLWEYNLFGKTPMPNIYPVRTENESDGVRLYYQDGWTQKVGQVGVIESSYVCLITRDGLAALDPAKGTVLWTKSNVSPRVQLMGDENFVFVFESNNEGGVTSARAVRASDGVEVQIQDSSQVFSNIKKSKTAGRRVLVLDEKSDKKSMRLYDILTGKDDWKKEIDGNAVLLRCEDPNLTGYVSDKGDVAIFSVKDGKEIFSGKLDSKKLTQHMDKVENAVLLTDRDRFFVVLNRPLENNNNVNYNPSLTPGIRTLRVNGHIYCFDRTTKKRLWVSEEQFENQQIILDQFQDLPIVIGAHWYNRINNGVFEGNGLRVVALDKRSGKALFRKEVPPAGPFHALNTDPKTGTVELIRSDMRIRFTPDDGKPASSTGGTPTAAVTPVQPIQPFAQPIRAIRQPILLPVNP